MENKAVIKTALYQADKVVYRIGGNFGIELSLHNIAVFHLNRYNWVLHDDFLLY